MAVATRFRPSRPFIISRSHGVRLHRERDGSSVPNQEPILSFIKYRGEGQKLRTIPGRAIANTKGRHKSDPPGPGSY